MNETCPTCGQYVYKQCEGEVGYDIQSGPLQCKKKATHYVRGTNRATGVRETTYWCFHHYEWVMRKENRRKFV